MLHIGSANPGARFDRSITLDFAQPRFQRTVATIMFTDVEDSTGLAMALGLAETTRFLTEHVAMTQRVVRRHGGMVQNFTGDGILALWLGTQMTPKDTALGALAAAAELTPEIAMQNAQRRSQGFLARPIRIGLHSGEVMFVNGYDSGSFVVGAEVNFARRVEQAGKAENREAADALVMASGATLRLAGLDTESGDAYKVVRLTPGELSTLRRHQ